MEELVREIDQSQPLKVLSDKYVRSVLNYCHPAGGSIQATGPGPRGGAERESASRTKLTESRRRRCPSVRVGSDMEVDGVTEGEEGGGGGGGGGEGTDEGVFTGGDCKGNSAEDEGTTGSLHWLRHFSESAVYLLLGLLALFIGDWICGGFVADKEL